MAVYDISNDTRGWIMCFVSGIGASAHPPPQPHPWHKATASAS